MAQNNIGSNIKRLRLARGYTQEELAEAAKISSAAFRNYEVGRAIPKVDTLIAIAAKLEAGLDELVAEPKFLSYVRFRADRRLNTREAILADVARWLEDYAYLEVVTGQQSERNLGEFESNEPKQLAADVRKQMDIRDDQPIRDICGLLEAYGIKLWSKPVKSEYFFGLSIGREDGGPAIVVNTWDRIPVERWIFSAAHELGHILLHQSSFNVNEQDEIEQQEIEANQFASYFLMPEDLFWHEWNETEGQPFIHRVLKVKRMLKVSYATVLYRLHESQRFQNVWTAFYAQYQRHYGQHLTRKREPNPLGPEAFFVENKASREPKRLDDVDFVEDRLSKLVYNALDGDLITRDRAAEILDISPDEMLDRIEDWVA